jgi:hypothetical protein
LCGHDDLSQFVEKSNPKNGKIAGFFARNLHFYAISPGISRIFRFIARKPTPNLD